MSRPRAKFNRQQVKKRLVDKLSEILETRPERLKKSLAEPLDEIKFDSLIGVEVITCIAEEFGVELPPDVFSDQNQKKFVSIAGLLDLLEKQISKGGKPQNG